MISIVKGGNIGIEGVGKDIPYLAVYKILDEDQSSRLLHVKMRCANPIFGLDNKDLKINDEISKLIELIGMQSTGFHG